MGFTKHFNLQILEIHRLKIEITFRVRILPQSLTRTDGFKAPGAVDFAIKQVGKYF